VRESPIRLVGIKSYFPIWTKMREAIFSARFRFCNIYFKSVFFLLKRSSMLDTNLGECAFRICCMPGPNS
jgi:hypothetical protein